MVKSFDIPANSVETDHNLQSIDAQELNAENWQVITESGDDPLDNNDVDGWVNEIPLLTHNECADLDDQVRLVHIALAKVR